MISPMRARRPPIHLALVFKVLPIRSSFPTVNSSTLTSAETSTFRLKTSVKV
jgi:hypothetical protein